LVLRIAQIVKNSGGNVPEWMLSLEKPSKEKRKELKKKPIEREKISTVPKYDLWQRQKKKQYIENSKRNKGSGSHTGNSSIKKGGKKQKQ